MLKKSYLFMPQACHMQVTSAPLTPKPKKVKSIAAAQSALPTQATTPKPNPPRMLEGEPS